VIGNLPPKERLVIEIKLTKFLEVEGGAYAFRLPVSYFPNYGLGKNGQYNANKLAEGHNYTFDYSVNLQASSEITWFSAPSDGDSS